MGLSRRMFTKEFKLAAVAAAGAREFDWRGGTGVGSESERAAPLAA